MDLDWDWPEFAPADPASKVARPLKVEVLLLDPALVLQEAHPLVQGVAGAEADQVLEHHGDPTEGTVRKPRLHLLARLVEQGVDDGVELGVELLDAGDGVVDELGGGDLALPHELGLSNCVQVAVHDRTVVLLP